MKTIKSIALLSLLAFSLLYFSSCQKKNAELNDENTAFAQKAEDEANIEGASAQMMDEVNQAIEDYPTAGKGMGPRPLCGGTVDTSEKAQGIIYVNYDGTTICRGRIREGKIKIERIGNTKWTDVGAKRKLTLIDLKITNVGKNKSLTLNGTREITNVNGGTIKDMQTGQSIVHQIRGKMNVLFDNNTSREWNVARKRTFSLDSNKVITAENVGDTSIGGNANVVFWGKNRTGEDFLTSTPTAIKANSTCGFDEPIAGVVHHHKMDRNFNLTFGVDKDGNSISSGCAFGYKIEFKNRKGEDVKLVKEYK